MDWTPAEQTATDTKGNKVALIKGQWVPVSKSATNAKGEKMVMLSQPQQEPKSLFEGVGESAKTGAAISGGIAATVGILGGPAVIPAALAGGVEGALVGGGSKLAGNVAERVTGSKGVGLATELLSGFGAAGAVNKLGRQIYQSALPASNAALAPVKKAAGEAATDISDYIGSLRGVGPAYKKAVETVTGSAKAMSEQRELLQDQLKKTFGEPLNRIEQVGSGIIQSGKAKIAGLLGDKQSAVSHITNQIAKRTGMLGNVEQNIQQLAQPDASHDQLLESIRSKTSPQSVSPSDAITAQKEAGGAIQAAGREKLNKLLGKKTQAEQAIEQRNSAAAQTLADVKPIGSDQLGQSMQPEFTKAFEEAKGALSKQAKTDYELMESNAAKREATGDTFIKSKEYQEYLQDSEKRLASKVGEASKLTPGEQNAIRGIHAAITGNGKVEMTVPAIERELRRIIRQSGVDPVTGIKTPVDKVILDEVKHAREAIGEYAGGFTDARQRYAEMARTIDNFKLSNVGRLFTGEKEVAGAIKTDPKSIPAAIFSSVKNVKDAKDALQNPEMFAQFARQHVDNELTKIGKYDTAKKWLNDPDNKAWMKEAGIEKHGEDYLNSLKQVEQSQKNIAKARKGFQDKIENVAKNFNTGSLPEEAFRKLMDSGSLEDLQHVASSLTDRGRESIAKGVRSQVLDKGMSEWAGVRSKMEQSGLMTPQQLSKMDSEVLANQKSKIYDGLLKANTASKMEDFVRNNQQMIADAGLSNEANRIVTDAKTIASGQEANKVRMERLKELRTKIQDNLKIKNDMRAQVSKQFDEKAQQIAASIHSTAQGDASPRLLMKQVFSSGRSADQLRAIMGHMSPEDHKVLPELVGEWLSDSKTVGEITGKWKTFSSGLRGSGVIKDQALDQLQSKVDTVVDLARKGRKTYAGASPEFSGKWPAVAASIANTFKDYIDQQ